MFERMRTSFDLAHSAWRVLLSDKKLIVFPLFSGLSCLLVLASFAVPVLMSQQLQDMLIDHQSPLAWGFLFVFYFINYFFIVFFNSALMSCALKRLNGGEPTLGDGLSAAANRLPQIAAWALVSATVGVLLKAIENVHEKAGAFISAILGTAWTVITFFVVPVLVVENVGPIDAIKRSLAILKKTWGESLIGNLGLGLFTFLLVLPGVAMIAIAGWLFTLSPALGGVAMVVAIVYLILWGAASSALNGIFVSALYQFAAQGQVPESFDRHQFEQAFRAKPV
jgi:hypothetical protein